jgi:hypothetical protein
MLAVAVWQFQVEVEGLDSTSSPCVQLLLSGPAATLEGGSPAACQSLSGSDDDGVAS